MNNKNCINRRSFLKTSGTITAGVALLNFNSVSTAQTSEKISQSILTATDQVELGKTGIMLSRLGFGCGTNSGAIQREMGQEHFNRMIRHAYENGITYFDSAESYHTHTWLKEALKGIPREKLFIQTKIPGWGIKNADEAFSRIEGYLKELGTDYIDSLLIHCQTDAEWNQKARPIMDGISKAKEKKMIRTHGISAHSIPALRTGLAEKWCETMLIRLNPQGHITDSETAAWNAPSSVDFIPTVVDLIKKINHAGKGTIAMKLVGNGDFKKASDREKAMRFAMNIKELNAAVIGFKNTEEVDESIERMNNALKTSSLEM